METRVAHEPATYEDLLSFPPSVTGQTVDGELCVTPGPASPNATTASMPGGGTPLLRHLLHGMGQTSSEGNR